MINTTDFSGGTGSGGKKGQIYRQDTFQIRHNKTH